MSQIVLSIIVPIYNASKTLPRTLKSIDFNLCNEIEVILVNDGSTENIDKVVAPWLKSFPNCIQYVKKPNGNWLSAVDYGKLYAHGTFVKVLDADDTFISNQLKINIEFLKQIPKNVDLVLSSFAFLLEKKNKIIKRNFGKTTKIILTTFDRYKLSKSLTHHCLFFRLNFLKKILPLPENFRFGDNILIYKAILNSKQIAILPKENILYLYHLGVNHQQTSFEQMKLHINDIERTLEAISSIKSNKVLSKNRSRLLRTIARGMFFLPLLLLYKSKFYYAWQRQFHIDKLVHDAKKIEINGLLRIVTRSEMNIIKNGNARIILLMCGIAFSIIQTGFIGVVKKSENSKPHPYQ